jgi:hypothetical protein
MTAPRVLHVTSRPNSAPLTKVCIFALCTRSPNVSSVTSWFFLKARFWSLRKMFLYALLVFSGLRGRLHENNFQYESAYDLLQIGWRYDSLYGKKIKHLNTIRLPVRIALRFDALQLKPGKNKITFPGIGRLK